MKMMKFGAMIVIAIGLCAVQCRALTPDELKQKADLWLSQQVSRITDDEQKKLVASHLFWKIREIVADSSQERKVARVAALATAATPVVAASDAIRDSDRAANDAAGGKPAWTSGAERKAAFEAFYTALWNSGKESGKTFGDRLKGQAVLMGPAGINF